MTCRCSEFGPLELKRGSIHNRACQSKAIKASLKIVARDGEGYASLWKCGVCGQAWQSGFVSGWHGREYFFATPPIEPADWKREPYAAPAALCGFTARIQSFVDTNSGQEVGPPCGARECLRRATRLSKFCLPHHIEMLQRAGLLPAMPQGRLLAPYEWIGELPRYLEGVS